MGSSVSSATLARVPADPLASYVRLIRVQGALPGLTRFSPILVGIKMNSKNKKSKKKQKCKRPEYDMNAKGTDGSALTVVDNKGGQSSLVDRLWVADRANALCERQQTDTSCSSSASSDEEHLTSTTRQYINLTKTKQDLREMQRELMQFETEAEIGDMTQRVRLSGSTRSSKSAVSTKAAEYKDGENLENLKNQLKNAVATILKVSSISLGLNSSCSTILEDTAASIDHATATLLSPTLLEEVTRLKDENNTLEDENVHLEAENSFLNAEIVHLRKELAQVRVEKTATRIRRDNCSEFVNGTALEELVPCLRSHPELENFTRSVMLKAEEMINARFAELEERLLPPRHQAIPPAAVCNTEYSTNAETLQSPSESSINEQLVTREYLPDVPVAANIEISDVSTQSLRTTLNQDDVRDSRLMKYAEVRLSGLDETVSPEEVVIAVAQAGGCHPNRVKCGSIRRNFREIGVAIVRCPIAVAKRLQEGRRVVVGWSSAKVKILDPKPPRCFRCLHIGHVGAQCTSEVDHSDICFRCGKNGHKAVSCTAPPHCVVCAAAGKPHNHPVGTKTCGVTPN